MSAQPTKEQLKVRKLVEQYEMEVELPPTKFKQVDFPLGRMQPRDVPSRLGRKKK